MKESYFNGSEKRLSYPCSFIGNPYIATSIEGSSISSNTHLSAVSWNNKSTTGLYIKPILNDVTRNQIIGNAEVNIIAIGFCK